MAALAELSRLSKAEQAQLAGQLLELALLEEPQTTPPHNYPLPPQRYSVLQNKLKRYQLLSVLSNVKAGYGTLAGLAHIFAPEDIS